MKEWKYFVMSFAHRYCGKVLCFIGKNLLSEKLLIAANKQYDKALETMTVFRDLRVNK